VNTDFNDDGDDDEELFKGGWLVLARYPAMLGGTLAGQLLGILIDVAIDSRGLWIPAACSVLLEGAIGARFGGLDGEPRLDRAQALKVSMTYSLTILVVSAPLIVWVGLSHIEAVPKGVGLSFLTPLRVAVALVALAAATAIRAGLLLVFAPRARVGS
jgi:hypothetical protein